MRPTRPKHRQPCLQCSTLCHCARVLGAKLSWSWSLSESERRLLVTKPAWSDWSLSESERRLLVTKRSWSDWSLSEFERRLLVTKRSWSDWSLSESERRLLVTKRSWSDWSLSESERRLLVTKRSWSDWSLSESERRLLVTKWSWSDWSLSEFERSTYTKALVHCHSVVFFFFSSTFVISHIESCQVNSLVNFYFFFVLFCEEEKNRFLFQASNPVTLFEYFHDVRYKLCAPVYSLVQWNWFSGVIKCTWVTCISDVREPISLHQAVHACLLCYACQK